MIFWIFSCRISYWRFWNVANNIWCRFKGSILIPLSKYFEIFQVCIGSSQFVIFLMSELNTASCIATPNCLTFWACWLQGMCCRYYYNKVTKQSKWTMPEEMKVEECLKHCVYQQHFSCSCCWRGCPEPFGKFSKRILLALPFFYLLSRLVAIQSCSFPACQLKVFYLFKIFQLSKLTFLLHLHNQLGLLNLQRVQYCMMYMSS